MTAAEYQATFTRLVSDGYRLIEVDGYGANGQAHYAAIFAKRGGPAWIARHGLSASAFQQEFDTRVRDGYRLVEISGYSVNGQTLYAAIFDKSTGSPWVARHGMTSDEYQAWFNKLVSAGYRLRNVDGYAVGSDARYAAIFDKSAGPPWIARHGMTSAEYQKEFDARVAEGYRLRLVSGYAVGNTARYAAIFEKVTGPAWVSFHGMSASDYQRQFDKFVGQGYQLDWVSGYVVAGVTLYAAIWSQAAAVNLLKNPGFEEPRLAPSILNGKKQPGISAAPEWRTWNNTGPKTTTEIVPSTRPGGSKQMLHVTTLGEDDGIDQIFGAFGTGPARTKSGAWVFVERGSVGIGTGNGGDTSDRDATTGVHGQWVHLEAANGATPANAFIVFATSPGGASFFVDDASVVAA